MSRDHWFYIGLAPFFVAVYIACDAIDAPTWAECVGSFLAGSAYSVAFLVSRKAVRS